MSFHQFNDSTAAILVREDELPPDRVEGGVPSGWELTDDDPIEFNLNDGEAVEVYVLGRSE